MLLTQIERYLSSLRAHSAPANTNESAPSSPPEVVPSSAGEDISPGALVVPLAPKQRKPQPDYAPAVLQGYRAFYDAALKECAMKETKKVAAPIPQTLYDRMKAYLDAHKGQEGYPQTILEFTTLSLEYLLRDLQSEERSLTKSA